MSPQQAQTGIINMQDKLQKEVDNLASALKQNGYPANFIRNGSAPSTQEIGDTSSCDEGQKEEKGPLVVIPYVAGMSKDMFAGSSTCATELTCVIASPVLCFLAKQDQHGSGES